MTYIAYPISDISDTKQKRKPVVTVEEPKEIDSHINAIKHAKNAGWKSLSVTDVETGETFVYRLSDMKILNPN